MTKAAKATPWAELRVQVMQQLPSNRNKRLAEVLSFLLRRLGSLFAEFLIRQHEIDVAKA
ncbi:hypothetical protein IVB14_01500 [Bradyrhizobium sp. 180]|uniref:hypothetical protein n=1 Tax=unclassified Bradyrhizobium TaxID=2631580 RepID=UPI001FFAF517|nr:MULTISPECIES: hypothetical protein [unclassified Bradyrhizobium]MCK1421609.1 hypothetical protein [Bradyrhizobium sp. CW12]MCK1489146.1 hypothetical protein [Bradyrhizobium sp. 180]MCK1645733.1 hypothetical protein [Bradyrhizobium sp. 154]